jgi:hypothetical protein
MVDVAKEGEPTIEGGQSRSGIGLCLSGGGYRAMLFHVDALWRLNELGWLPRLAFVSSVSGGSITAGLLARNWRRLNFTQDVADNFSTVVVRPLRTLAGRTSDPSAHRGVANRVTPVDQAFLHIRGHPRKSGWNCGQLPRGGVWGGQYVCDRVGRPTVMSDVGAYSPVGAADSALGVVIQELPFAEAPDLVVDHSKYPLKLARPTDGHCVTVCHVASSVRDKDGRAPFDDRLQSKIVVDAAVAEHEVARGPRVDSGSWIGFDDVPRTARNLQCDG